MSEGSVKGLEGLVAEGELNFVVDKAMLSASGTNLKTDSVLCFSGVQPRNVEDKAGYKPSLHLPDSEFIQESALAAEFSQTNAGGPHNLQEPQLVLQPRTARAQSVTSSLPAQALEYPCAGCFRHR